MLNQKIEQAFNEQLNAEAYSAYLYWSMSAYFESMNLKGFASWMRVQALEEMTHTEKFFRFINERGGRVKLAAIGAPAVEWESPLAAFEAAYGHETIVTGRINKLADLAVAESDHASQIFLQWFVTEQVEEEASADDVVQKLKLVGDSAGPLFMVDQELGQRVFTPPPAGE
ncbi:MAG: ferritin [Planctomycetota bacterium]|jgi:ferritin